MSLLLESGAALELEVLEPLHLENEFFGSSGSVVGGSVVDGLDFVPQSPPEGARVAGAAVIMTVILFTPSGTVAATGTAVAMLVYSHGLASGALVASGGSVSALYNLIVSPSTAVLSGTFEVMTAYNYSPVAAGVASSGQASGQVTYSPAVSAAGVLLTADDVTSGFWINVVITSAGVNVIGFSAVQSPSRTGPG